MTKKFSFPSIWLALPMMVFSLFLISCKDREDEPSQNVELQFKVMGTDINQINAVVTQIGTIQDSKFNLPGQEFTSPKSVVNRNVGSVQLSATATGTKDAATLTVLILLNGQVASKNVVNGKNLSVSTTLQLYQQYH